MLKKEVKATLVLAGPVVATQLAHISMGFVDTVMVGRLGSQALAGVALANSIFFTTLVIAMGVVMSVGPMVSQAFGAGDSSAVGRSVRQGLWLGGLLAVPGMLVVRNIGPVLLAVGQDVSTVEMAVDYLHAISWGMLPFLWFVALRSFVEGVSRPRPPTVISFAGVGLNIVSNYILMYGKLGLPAMGLTGTGWASTIVFWFMCLALAGVTAKVSDFKGFSVFSRLGRPDPSYFRQLFTIGWPIGVGYGVEAGLFMVTALMMGTLGTVALAAHQIAIQCAAFTFMVPLGIGIATSVRVGQAVGRRDRRGIRSAGDAGVGLAALFMLFAAFAFWTFPRIIVGLYIDVGAPSNHSVVALASSLLGIAAVFQIFDGVQVSAAGALRGLKDTRSPMIIGLVSYWAIGLTSGYTFGFWLGYGPPGLWWGLVLGLVAAAWLLAARFRRQAALALVVADEDAAATGEGFLS